MWERSLRCTPDCVQVQILGQVIKTHLGQARALPPQRAKRRSAQTCAALRDRNAVRLGIQRTP
jgi:hypothetical protein